MSWDFSSGQERIVSSLASTYSGGDYTLGCWIKYSNHPAAVRNICGIGATDLTTTNSFGVRLTAAENIGIIAYDNVPTLHAPNDYMGDSIFDNRWFPVIAYYHGNNNARIKYGFDENLTSVDNSVGTMANIDLLSIGGIVSTNSDLVDFKLAEVVVWDGSVPYQEGRVPFNLNTKNPFDIFRSQQIAYFPLNQNSTTQIDRSPAGASDVVFTTNRWSEDHPPVAERKYVFPPIKKKVASPSSWRMGDIGSVDVNDSKNSFGVNAGTGWPSSTTQFTSISLFRPLEIPGSPSWRFPRIYKTGTTTNVVDSIWNGTVHTAAITLTGPTTYTRNITFSFELNNWYALVQKWTSGSQYTSYIFRKYSDEWIMEAINDNSNQTVSGTLDTDSGRVSFAGNGGGERITGYYTWYPKELTYDEILRHLYGKLITADDGTAPDVRLRYLKNSITNISGHRRISAELNNAVRDVWFESGPATDNSERRVSSPIKFIDEEVSKDKFINLPTITKNSTKRIPNKPILDLNDSINKDIAICVLPGIYGGLNLANGKSGTVIGSSFGGSKYGECKNLPNGTSSTPDTATNYIKDIPYTSVNQEWTVVWVGRADLKANDEGLFTSRVTTDANWNGFQFWCKGTAGDGSPYAMVANGAAGNVTRATGAVDFLNPAGSPDDPGYDMIAVVRYNGDGQNPAFSAYYNGYFDEGGDATGFTMSHATTASIGAYYDFSGHYSQHGKVSLAAYWDRAVSDEELLLLSKNPFQIFKMNNKLTIASDATKFTKFVRIKRVI